MKHEYYYLLIFISLATIFLFVMNTRFALQSGKAAIKFSNEEYEYVDMYEPEYFIKTEGCIIPAFEPFDKSVVKYFNYEDPILCFNETNPPLVESDQTSIWIIEKYLSNYSVIDNREFSCCYTPFDRQYSCDGMNEDDCFQFKKKCVQFSDKINITHQFIKVECHYKQQKIYEDFHSFVIKDLNKDRTSGDKFNVLVLGIDAVSRLNFHRTMPKTLKYLQYSDAIEFKGYNKVGDNTYPNLIPVLSGLNEKELGDTCYQNDESRFDDCPFIWKTYSDAGYYTAFGEDAAPISLFNYLKNGFIDKPTDFYWRTFNALADKEIGHENRWNANLCLGPRLSVDVLLSYVQKLVRSMSGSSFFGFFWETSLTHDELNYPLLGDEKYAALMESMENDDVLNNTILILMSDHGIRWGDIRSTHQGQVEERLPFLFFVLPKRFKKNYPLAVYNMKKNTRQLTTPFDLHETLLDLMDTSELLNENIRQKLLRKNYMNYRGISLFLPIHGNRTCQSAEISPHWCTCHQTRNLDVNDEFSVFIASFVVNYINSLLIDHDQCVKLSLKKVLDLSVGEPSYLMTATTEQGETVTTEQRETVTDVILDYTIILETNPGPGVFEATLRNTTNGWNVTGSVSRINLYGKQSACIDDYHLKLYCYCDNYISTT